MEGNFKDGRNSAANVAGTIIFIVGFIATVIISLNVGMIFNFIGISVTAFLMFIVIERLAKGEFSADEKSVSFSVGFSKYECSYRNIINIKTEIVFTEGRGNSKYPHIELVLSLRNGKIVRFSDTVPSSESESLESLREYQKNHQFTELAEYIQGFIKQR